MPGGRDSVGGGVWETDDGRGSFLPGAIEGKVAVQGVRNGDGDWFSGVAHVDTTWEGGEVETELGTRANWKVTADILDGLPNRRRTTELPG